MNMAKIYHDSDGNDCSISQMVRREPDWAANRVQVGELDTERLDWILHRVSGRALRNIGVEYSGGVASMREAIDKAMSRS